MVCTRATLLAVLSCWAATALYARQPEPIPEVLNLPRVLALVRESNPQVIAARLRAEAAAADILSAKVPFPSNPVLGLELGDRSGPEGDGTDFLLAVGQNFYTGPVRGRHVRAAEAARDVARHLARDEMRLAEAAAARLFQQAVAAGERVALAREVETVTRRLVDVAEVRFEAGEDTALSVNTARIQRFRAGRSRLEAEQQARRVRALLAAVLGLDPAADFKVEGTLDLPVDLPEEGLEEVAGERADVAASRDRVRELAETLSWRKAERWPELEANLFYKEEGGTEIIRGGGLGVRIPLADRRKGAIARARAEELEAEALHRAKVLEARSDLVRAREAFRTADRILSQYGAEFLAAARENLSLMELAFREGKVRIAEVLVLRQVLVQAREEHLQARLNRALATIDLLVAAGLPLMEANHAL